MLFYVVIYTFRGSLDFFPMLMPKPCSGDFKVQKLNKILKKLRKSEITFYRV